MLYKYFINKIWTSKSSEKSEQELLIISGGGTKSESVQIKIACEMLSFKTRKMLQLLII